MNYEELSNEELYFALREKFPRASFKPVTEKSRPVAIQLLKFWDQQEGGAENVQSENQR